MGKKPPRPAPPKLPTAWAPPSGNLQSMAASIGRDRALTEFYKALVEEQWEYDDEEHDTFNTLKIDRRRHTQAVDLMDHREWLKTGEEGRGNQSGRSFGPSGETQVETTVPEITGLTSLDYAFNMLTQNKDQTFDKGLAASSSETNNMGTVAAKEAAKAQAKQDSEDREADWWHDLKEAVDPYLGVPEFTKDAGSVVANSAVGKAAGKGGLFALEQLSRTGHAMAGAADEWFALDDDVNREQSGLERVGEGLEWLTQMPLKGIGALLGQDPTNSLDDLSFGGLGNVAKGAGRGFSLQDRKTFSDVIRSNALRDTDENIYDRAGYQAVAGLGADIVLDPLNLVGVGIVKAPLKAAQAGRRASDLGKLADEAAGIGVRKGGTTTGDEFYSRDEIFDLIGGNIRVTSKAGRIRAEKDTLANLDYINREIGRPPVGQQEAMKGLRNRLTKHEARVAKLQKERQAALDKHGADILIDEVIEASVKAEKNGTVPKGSTDGLVTNLKHSMVNTAFNKSYGAKKKGVAPEVEFANAIGDIAGAKPEDIIGIFKNIDELVKRKNPSLAAEHWQAFKGRAQSPTRFKQVQRRYNIEKAEVFRQAINARIRKNLGNPIYSDPQRAAVLQQIINEAARQITKTGTEAKTLEGLAKPSAGEGSSAIRSESKAEFDIESGHDTPLTGVHNASRGDLENLEAGDLPDVDLADVDAAFTPDERFFSYGDQLQQVHLSADKELRSLEAEFADSNFDELGIPSQFRLESGEFDKVRFKSLLEWNPDRNEWVAKSSGWNGELDSWVNRVVTEFNTKFNSEFSRLVNNEGKRRTNEAAVGKAETEITVEDVHNLLKLGDEDAKQLLTMFGKPGETKKGTSPFEGSPERADRVLYPFVRVSGKQVYETGSEARKLVTDLDRTKSDGALEVIKNPLKNLTTEDDSKWFYETLVDRGLVVSKDPEALYRYVEANKDSLLLDFTPEKIAFAREFKSQHGMSLENARELRAQVLGKTVESYAGSMWSKKFPKGLSQGKFVRLVSSAQSPTELIRITDGAPFNFSIPKREASSFGRSPAYRNFSGSKEGRGWKYLWESDKPGFKAALKEAGIKQGSTLEDVKAIWAEDVFRYHRGLTPKKLKETLNGLWEGSYKKTNAARLKEKKARADKYRENLPMEKFNELRNTAARVSFDRLAKQLEEGDVVKQYAEDMYLPTDQSAASDVKQAITAKAQEELDSLKVDKSNATSMDEVAQIDAKIEAVKKQHAKDQAALVKHVKEARESREVLKRRLKEEAILRIADASLEGGKALSVNVAGQAFRVPTSQILFKAAEKAGSLPVIKQVFGAYRDAFMSQAKLLPEEMEVIRNRAISNPSEVISHHIRELKLGLGQRRFHERSAVYRGYVTGAKVGDSKIYDEIDRQFTSLLPYFQGKVPVGHGNLTIKEINRYLPEEFKLSDDQLKVYYKTGQDLARALLAKEIKVEGKRRRVIKRSHDPNSPAADPVRAIWVARVAAEQAMARKALVHAINDTFGIRRGYKVDFKTGEVLKGKSGSPMALAGMDGLTRDVIEKLKDQGWKTIPKFGDTHYFPPESVGDIERLLDMFEPRNITAVGRLIDEATGIWKSSVTIYNPPGYYVRNAVGEVMSAWLGGVHDIRAYRRASGIMRFMTHEGKEVEALQAHMPALMHKVETNSDLGKKFAVRLGNGRNLSNERVAVLYRDQGLSTGFINTEYGHHYGAFKDKARALPGIKQAGRVNEKLRAANEVFEDYFRMAHFVDSLGKAPRNLTEQGAAEWAARQVRKYHFDYTDFTKAEKTVLLRAFPFYKWTRKALPLMVGMLFVKPGKMMVYPKTMNAVSEATVGTEDLSGNDNGFMPNYNGIVPSWVQENWAYQVGGPTDGSGDSKYARLQTPQMDALNTAGSPLKSFYNLLNPIAKLPYEQVEGETKGNMNLPVVEPDERIEHLVRGLSPLGGVAMKAGQGEMNLDDIIRFMGLGYYDVSEKSKNMAKARGEY